LDGTGAAHVDKAALSLFDGAHVDKAVLALLDDARNTKGPIHTTGNRHVDGSWLGFEGGGLVDWNVWFEVKGMREFVCEIRANRGREGMSTRYLYL
jgi:hypothetical protein